MFADINLVFFAWFTYEAAPPDVFLGATPGSNSQNAQQGVGDSDHRWMTGQGPFDGSSAVLQATLTQGGIFDDSAAVNNSVVGSIILTFSSCEEGIMQYDFGDGLSGRIPLQRIAADNVALCESLQ